MKTTATLILFFFIILPTQSIGSDWAPENESDQLRPPFSDVCTAEQFCSELDDKDSEIILPRKNKEKKQKRKRKRKKSGSQHSNEHSPPNSPSSKKTGQKRKRDEKEPADPDQPPRKMRYKYHESTEKLDKNYQYPSLRRKKKIKNSSLSTNKAGHRTYDKEFKLNAVLLYKNGKSAREVCRDLEIPGSTFRGWIKYYD